jgi:hypothetical protein
MSICEHDWLPSKKKEKKKKKKEKEKENKKLRYPSAEGNVPEGSPST